MLAADLLQIGGLVEWGMKWIKANASFGASNALVKFVREWRRREAVYVDDQAVAKLTESSRDGSSQGRMLCVVIGRHQFSPLGMAENSQKLRLRAWCKRRPFLAQPSARRRRPQISRINNEPTSEISPS
jgi:hypothetical protein